MNNILIISQIYESMPDKDKAAFLEYLKGQHVKFSRTFSDFKSIVIKHNPAFIPDRPACAHCASTHVIKNGHKANEHYFCKDCGRTFAITDNTPVLLEEIRRSLGKIFRMFAEQVLFEKMRRNLRHRLFNGVYLETQNT